MDKTYQPESIEKRLAEHWEQSGFYAPSERADETPYCIMIPPPNVTGSLHMGHGFQHTLMDGLIRYHRMQGHNTLWQMGTDHAGIATQMVVERQLAKDKLSRHDLGRDAFVKKIWEWKNTSGGMITKQIRQMGSSVDWQTERFTMDPGMSKAVQETFIRLYEEDLIYRGQRLVNWDPKFQTAISDLEVVNEEEQGHLWHFNYPLVDKPEEHITIATTRPETMLGDTAIAVHPEDPRYQHLVGHYVQLPLTERTIPIIADDYVDPEFGSGCVKITPAHDFNDNAVGKRHNLPMINIMTPTAHMNAHTPEDFQGLDRYEAREKVVAEMKALGLLVKIEDHTMKVPRGDRSSVVIEPMLTDQWFVRAQALAEPAIAAVKNGEIRFIPENWQNTYFQWLENIEDWCISRQLWWGHRIPAYYDEQGNLYVGEDEAAVRKKHDIPNEIVLTQDEDVLDTWFSSALWPFSTLGWPEETERLKTFYPTNVLITGFDIIFFWVARMVMMGLKFTGKIPFKDVYITGLIRDAEGNKMSKSKGNVLDPLDLIHGIGLEDLVEKRTGHMMQPHLAAKIEKATRKHYPEGIDAYGTDALRFTFFALASTSRDINFDIKRLEGYRNFCNKLWNSARFVLMNTEEHAGQLTTGEHDFSAADRWILAKLQQTIAKTHQYYENYRFDHLAAALYEFTWQHFCDWYLELVKPVLNDESAPAALKAGARYTLLNVLETLLRLMHPLIPFVTEEIWQKVAPLINRGGETLMRAPYPTVDDTLVDERIVDEMAWTQEIISHVRTIKGEMNISPKTPVPLVVIADDDTVKEKIERYQMWITALPKVSEIRFLNKGDEAPAAAKALVTGAELLIPLAGLIDTADEMKRLAKNIEKLDKDLARCQGKLANQNFIASAPQAVVAKEKARLAEFQAQKAKLEASVSSLRSL